MSDNKRNGRGFGKGYYIALILCATAIGIAGYLYNRNANEAANMVSSPVSEATVSAEAQQEDVAVIATRPRQAEPETEIPSATETTSGQSALKTVSPLSGATVAVYSMESLSYNQTTRDWRVHDGMDIAAEAGSQVCAAAEGEVISVSEDDALGHTVRIRHIGGYETCYASLAEPVQVKAGDSVTAGQVIGTVGDTALVETAMGPHLHFAISYRGEPVDPAEFLELDR